MDSFRWARYEFFLLPEEEIILPEYKGSALRGGFGHAFRKAVCIAKDKTCPECLLKEKCIYSYVFDTPTPKDSRLLSKNSYQPHPFVIEPPMEERRLYSRDVPLVFGLILIGLTIEYLPYFIFTFDELDRMGMGKGRGRYRLEEVFSLKGSERKKIYSGEDKVLRDSSYICTWEEFLQVPLQEVERLKIRFLTPVRIKHEGKYASRLPFHVLVQSLLTRISSLSYFHCGRELDMDFKRELAEAQAISIEESHLYWQDWERYSKRQDTRMKLGGVMGEVTYTGSLTKFLPYLLLGQELHVGKATSFGLGKMEIIL